MKLWRGSRLLIQQDSWGTPGRHGGNPRPASPAQLCQDMDFPGRVLGPEPGWVCWETSTIYLPTGGKLLGPGCALTAAFMQLSSFSQIPPLLGKFPSKMGSAGDTWGGLWLWWAAAVNSPLCLPQAPVLARPKGFAPACASAPHLPNSSNSFPHPYTYPKIAWPGCRARLSEVGKCLPASALQRADNDMLTCLFVPLPHSVEM